MRFGDLLTSNLRLNALRHANYFGHLAKCGFRASDMVYQVFGYQSFHDSPIRMKPFNLKSHRVSMTLRNIAVGDMLNAQAPKPFKKKLALPRECFETTIVFHDVEQFRVDLGLQITRPAVYQATLGKKGDKYMLYIDVQDAARALVPPGRILITFGNADVEDITPKIEKAMRTKLSNRTLLRPLPHNPSYYASWFKKESK